MFDSLRSKILLLLLSLFALTAGLIMFFTDRHVGRAMFEAEERAARNVVRLTDLSLRGEYRGFLSYKIETAARMKALLKRRAASALQGVAVYQSLAKQGLLSEEQAKRQALDWLGGVTDGVQESLFVYDRSLTPLRIADYRLSHSALAELRDIKERSLAPTMYETASTYGDGFSIYYVKAPKRGEDAKRLGYFVFDARWGWVIAVSVDVGDVERAARQKLETVVESLRSSLAEIRIARSGYVFLFDGAGKVLAGPADRGELREDPAHVQNLLTGKPLLEELAQAAALGPDGSNSEPVRYMIRDAGGRERLKEAHVSRVKALDWYVASSVFVDEIEEPAKSLVGRQLLVIAAVFAAALALALLFVGRISGPLARLARHAKEISSQDFTAPREKASPLADLERRSDEVGRLARSFEFMQDELGRNVQRAMRVTAENERIESELKIARSIQMSILPKTFPAFPDRRELDVFAAIEPAKEVGGDLYDFFFVDDDHLCFVIGDVSGKGVPASFFMAVTKTLIKAAATRGAAAEEIMTRVNDDLSQGNESSMFVTLFLGLLDVTTGEIEFSNGGHNPPVIVRSDGVEPLRERHGPLVGAMEGVPYASSRLRLAPGETLFLYTDGVTEAMDESLALFGDERLLACLDGLRGSAPKEAINGVMAGVARFVGEADQSDDIAMLALRYLGG